MARKYNQQPFVLGKVRELPLEEAPSSNSIYWETYKDIRLRLEQTPPNYVVEYEVLSGSPSSAARSLKRLFSNRMGSKAVIVWHGTRETDGHPCLYARRGPNYPKAPQRKNGKIAKAEVSDFD